MSSDKTEENDESRPDGDDRSEIETSIEAQANSTISAAEPEEEEETPVADAELDPELDSIDSNEKIDPDPIPMTSPVQAKRSVLGIFSWLISGCLGKAGTGGRRLALSSRALIQLLQSQKQDFFVRYISDCSWKAG